MAQVSLPDGTIIPDFPDNPTPQDVVKLRTLGQQMEARMGASTLPGALKEAGRVAGTSIYDGVMGLPKLVGKGLEYITDRSNPDTGTPETIDLPSPDARREYLEKKRAELDPKNPLTKLEGVLKPKTELGQRTANVGSSVTGSMLYGGLGGASPGINFTSGLLGGVGSELLGKASNPRGPVEQDDPMAKLAGGLGGGIGGAAVHEVGRRAFSSQPLREKIARILNEGLTDRDVEVAARRMEHSAKEGVPLIAPQAFSKTTNVDKLAELANTSPLEQTRKVLNTQVDAMAGKASHELNQLPGRATQPTELANRSREKATDFFKTFGQERNQIAEGFLPELDLIPQKDLRGVNKALMDYLAINPNKPLAAEVVKSAREAMRNPEWKKELAKRQAAYAAAKESGEALPQFGKMPNKYVDRPDYLYGALDEMLAGNGKNAALTDQAQKISNRHAAEVRNIFKSRLRGELDSESGSFPNSLHPIFDEQQAAMKPVFEAEKAAMQEPVGRLLNATESQLGAPDSQSLVAVFKDPKYAPRSSSAGKGEISKLQQQLSKAPGSEDTTLFQDATKTFFQDAITESSGGAGTRNNPRFMENMLTKLGNPTRGGADPRWRQTKDILLANAADMGLTEAEAREAAHGFERLMVMAARTSQRGANPGVNASTIKAEASPEALRRIGGVNVMSVLRQPALWLQKIHEKRVLGTIDQWITTPDGLRAMRELSKAPTYKQMRSVLNTIGQKFGELEKNSEQFTTPDSSLKVNPNTSQEQ